MFWNNEENSHSLFPTAFLKTASNNVRSMLNLVKDSGKTKEVTGSWKRAGSFSRRLRRDHPSVPQKEIPNSSICDEDFLHRSRAQEASRALWRNLRTFTWDFFLVGSSNKNITHNVHVMWHLKIFLSPSKGCPLLPLVILCGVEEGQVQILPKASLVETQKTFEIGTDITDMLTYNKNRKVIS